MKVPFLDLTRQTDAMGDELREAIDSVLRKGRFVGGEIVERFESAFAAYCGAEHCVGVASGTDALELALRAAGIGHVDEVITAANTCVPTVAGIEASGATAVLADVDEKTRTLDVSALEDSLTERTRAIVPVHLYGRCADMEGIAAIAEAHNLIVIEDAAQAHGAEYRGRRAGSLGAAAAFSFYPTKNLGALGDAGAVVTDNAEIADRARLLRNYGEGSRYESVERGQNSRLDTLQAAVLTTKLHHLDDRNERRRALAAFYDETLAGTALGLPLVDGDSDAWHLYVVEASDRQRFRAELARSGVETLVHYPRAVHEHPAYLGLATPSLRRSERLAREVVSLPLYPELTDAEAEAVAAAVRAASGESS